MAPRPQNLYPSYHAHVYFDQSTLSAARELCTRAGEKFGVSVGRFHQKPVGPHPRWSCQLAFEAAKFDELIPWLDDNRNGLTILVHGRKRLQQNENRYRPGAPTHRVRAVSHDPAAHSTRITIATLASRTGLPD